MPHDATTTATAIDPREFGRLEAEVNNLKADLSAIRHDVRALLDLANRSRGAFTAWMFMSSALGGGAVLLVEWWVRRA